MIRLATMTRYKRDMGLTRWECSGKYGSVTGYKTPWQALNAYMALRERMRAHGKG